MWELRWVLLGLGALVIAGVYLWGRGLLARLPRFKGFMASRRAPAPDDDDEDFDLFADPTEPQRGTVPKGLSTSAPPTQTKPHTQTPTAATPDPHAQDQAPDPDPVPPAPDRIVTVRFIPRDKKLSSEEVLLALRAKGLRHGEYGIFHKLTDTDRGDAVFSVANLTEPGSFDLSNLSESTIPGMSFFMVLPGAGDPVERFDLMVDTARTLARDLDAELTDEKGSSWSIQRERYVREELIQYRHHLDRVH